MGPPGVGKGTQAKALVGGNGWAHLSTGELFRGLVQEQSDLGRRVKGYLDAGAYVPDDVTVAMVREWLRKIPRSTRVVFDGFPRTVAQAEALDALFARKGLTLDRVIYFNVSRPELLRRLTGRRVCRTCGHTYHLVSAHPKVAGKCDVCGGELYQRPDDREVTVANRLDVYEKQTAPLLDYYRERKLLAEISGEGPVDEVARAIRKAVDQPVTR